MPSRGSWVGGRMRIISTTKKRTNAEKPWLGQTNFPYRFIGAATTANGAAVPVRHFFFVKWLSMLQVTFLSRFLCSIVKAVAAAKAAAAIAVWWADRKTGRLNQKPSRGGMIESEICVLFHAEVAAGAATRSCESKIIIFQLRWFMTIKTSQGPDTVGIRWVVGWKNVLVFLFHWETSLAMFCLRKK